MYGQWRKKVAVVTLYFGLYSVFINYFALIVSSHTCNHIYPKDDEVITGVYLEDSHSIQKRETSKPLRIKIFYDSSVHRLSKAKFDLINDHILPEAVYYWEKALMVRKSEKVIRLNRRCANKQFFLVKDDPYPYCKGSCEKSTVCGEVIVPEEHLNECRVCDSSGNNCRLEGPPKGKGIPGADFIFYISALETARCQKGFTVAYAAHCQQEAALDRPIAGHANLCPSSISLKEQESKTLLSTVKHEILHALGFSVSLYAFFRDDNGLPLTDRTEHGKPILNEKLQARQWSEKVIKTVIRKDWKVRGTYINRKVNMIVTPRVAREARLHFGCPALEGGELEDQGQEGTVLAHWEKRTFENEAMTGTYTQNPVYSRITLALMEDTGWYHANYSMAQPLTWGSGLGCDFCMHSCMHWIDTQTEKGKSIHPYCNKVKKDPLETECTDDRNSVALCNLIEYEKPLPFHYQNFHSIPGIAEKSTANFGGSVALADFCPYIQEFTWKNQNVVVRGSHCHFPENNPDFDRNFALENYSDDSKCFDHKEEWVEKTCEQKRQWKHWGSGCYLYSCQDGRINIHVGNYTYACYHSNQVIPVKIYYSDWLHEGAIICPPCPELCEKDGKRFCKREIAKPASVVYEEDHLDCGSVTISHNLCLFVVTLFSLFKFLR